MGSQGHGGPHTVTSLSVGQPFHEDCFQPRTNHERPRGRCTALTARLTPPPGFPDAGPDRPLTGHTVCEFTPAADPGHVTVGFRPRSSSIERMPDHGRHSMKADPPSGCELTPVSDQLAGEVGPMQPDPVGDEEFGGGFRAAEAAGVDPQSSRQGGWCHS